MSASFANSFQGYGKIRKERNIDDCISYSISPSISISYPFTLILLVSMVQWARWGLLGSTWFPCVPSILASFIHHPLVAFPVKWTCFSESHELKWNLSDFHFISFIESMEKRISGIKGWVWVFFLYNSSKEVYFSFTFWKVNLL